jgi:hypothetical protein
MSYVPYILSLDFLASLLFSSFFSLVSCLLYILEFYTSCLWLLVFMEKGRYGTDMDTDSQTESGWLWLPVFCSVHGESVLEYITDVAVSETIPRQIGGRTRQKKNYLLRGGGETRWQPKPSPPPPSTDLGRGFEANLHFLRIWGNSHLKESLADLAQIRHFLNKS